MGCDKCAHWQEHAERRRSAMEAALTDLENAEVSLRSERRTVTRLKGEIAKLQDDLVAKDEVQAVFDYWKKNLRADSKRVILGPKRKEKIVARLKEGYGVEDLLKAVDGAKLDAFEKDGKRYDDLELILRDETKVERFMATAQRRENQVQAMIEDQFPDVIPGQTNILDELEKVNG